jgi:hypothetical protein
MTPQQIEFVRLTTNEHNSGAGVPPTPVADFIAYPHLFFLGAIMDRGISAKRAFGIPYKIADRIGHKDFHAFALQTENDYRALFVTHNLHRYNIIMSSIFYNAVQKIKTYYNGNAANIWNGTSTGGTPPPSGTPGGTPTGGTPTGGTPTSGMPTGGTPTSGTPTSGMYPLTSGELVKRMLSFDGVGIKIASMACNILVRDYHVKLADTHCIDVSPDVHVKRIFYRLGFVENINGTDYSVLITARDLNPKYPGMCDLLCWEIGASGICVNDIKKCKCGSCQFNNICPKIS